MIAIAGTFEWEREVAVGVIAKLLLSHQDCDDDSARQAARALLHAGEVEALQREAALRDVAAGIRKEFGFDT